MSELVEDKRCATCRWHTEDGLFCENPNSDFYGWFRNDWKKCDKYEEQENTKTEKWSEDGRRGEERMKNKCEICGSKVDYEKGGCAIMLAFCRNHSTNLMNVSYCAECYNVLLKEKFKAFADSACLYIVDMDDEEQDDGQI